MARTTDRNHDVFGVFGALTALAALFFGVIAVYVAARDDGATTTVAAAAPPVAVTLDDLLRGPTTGPCPHPPSRPTSVTRSGS